MLHTERYSDEAVLEFLHDQGFRISATDNDETRFDRFKSDITITFKHEKEDDHDETPF